LAVVVGSGFRTAAGVLLLCVLLNLGWERLAFHDAIPQVGRAMAGEPSPLQGGTPAPGGTIGPGSSAGPGNSEVYRRMLQELPAGTLNPQVHRFACARCHDPEGQPKTAEQWRATCQSAGCTLASNESKFHNLDTPSFKPAPTVTGRTSGRPTATTARAATSWRRRPGWRPRHRGHPAGHAGQPRNAARDRSGQNLTPTVPLAIAAMSLRTRATNGSNARAATIRPERHGVLKIKAPADCQACHHGPPAVATCETCHTGAATAGIYRLPVRMKLAEKAAPITRALSFDHGLHRELGCDGCHKPPYGVKPKVDCDSCHEFHHQPEAKCAGCHQTPAKAAHPLTLHDTGCQTAGCHKTDLSAAGNPERKLCLTCNVDRATHQPDQKCGSCHLVECEHKGKEAQK
jgi:hypothetical protein